MNPLEKKLRLHKMNSITLLNFPKEITVLDHLETNKKLQKKQDCIISFVEDLEAMKQLILKTAKDDSLNDQGVLFIVYPKLKNKLNKKGIHRDDILPYIKVDPDGDGFVDETHLKFNQMVSFDENYTCVGLKYFETIPKTKPTISMRVVDYEKYIPQLKKDLGDQVAYFESLTPGKQREWARHIFSAQRDETRQRRFKELVDESRKNK